MALAEDLDSSLLPSGPATAVDPAASASGPSSLTLLWGRSKKAPKPSRGGGLHGSEIQRKLKLTHMGPGGEASEGIPSRGQSLLNLPPRPYQRYHRLAVVDLPPE